MKKFSDTVYYDFLKHKNQIKVNKLYHLFSSDIKIVLGQVLKFLCLLTACLTYVCISAFVRFLKFVLNFYLQHKKIYAYFNMAYKKIKVKTDYSGRALFFYEFLKSPQTMGSIYPSSKKLADCMAKKIQVNPDTFIVELGAGTGTVTRALLKRGVPPTQLVVVEKSPKMVRHLRRSFPDITVLEGDAANLIDLLHQHGKYLASFVVSSLPLRSLPSTITQTIMMQVHKLLDEKGKLIQFTYDLRQPISGFHESFNKFCSEIVWINFPPARVNVFTPTQHPAERVL